MNFSHHFNNELAVCSYTKLLLFGRYWIYLLRLIPVSYFQGISDVSIIYNNTLITERSEGLVFFQWPLFNFVWAKLRMQNKTLKINCRCLLITLRLVHIKYTGCILHAALLVHIKYTVCTLHVTDDANTYNFDCRQGTDYYSTYFSQLFFLKFMLEFDSSRFCWVLCVWVSLQFLHSLAVLWLGLESATHNLSILL